MDYFLADGNVRRGPFPADQLLRQGMRPDTLVWRDGMPQWQPAEQVPELASMFSGHAQAHAQGHPSVPPPPPPGAYSQPPQYGYPPQQQYPGYGGPNSNVNGTKIAAGVCGIVLGWLGVHKFVLGMNTPGIIMLLISVVGGVVTCGISSTVIWIIGIVEGIMYLTKTDAEFQQMYMIEKKQWF